MDKRHEKYFYKVLILSEYNKFFNIAIVVEEEYIRQK